jgi:hypothetical protein
MEVGRKEGIKGKHIQRYHREQKPLAFSDERQKKIKGLLTFFSERP